jgi:hypothetical protein
MRFSERDDLRMSRVFPTSELEEAEADEVRRRLLDQGWTDRSTSR